MCVCVMESGRKIEREENFLHATRRFLWLASCVMISYTRDDVNKEPPSKTRSHALLFTHTQNAINIPSDNAYSKKEKKEERRRANVKNNQ